MPRGAKLRRCRLRAVFRAEGERTLPERRLEREIDGRVARIVGDEGRELAHDPGRRLPRVDAKLHLTSDQRRLEGAHLARDELRLPRLLVVDPALHDEDAVGLEEL